MEAAKTGDLAELGRILALHPGLVSQRLPSGESALMAAVYRGHAEVVDALVDAGATVDLFAAAATGRMLELGDALRVPGAVTAHSYDGWTALHLAAFFGHVDAIHLLLEGGADVRAVSRNTLENTPLHAATAGKHIAAALILLERGADPDSPDSGGYSARAIAAENQLDAVSAAINARAAS